jgi:serine/threonine protein kinase
MDLRESDPRNVGGYEILGRLGEGGSSTVFLAKAPDGTQVAIKVLHPTLAESPAVRERLRREAVTLQRVRSERTAGVLSVDADGPIPHLVMEFVGGQNLAVITEMSPLTGPLLTALAEGLIEALEAIHSCDVVHRDLKPQNILYGPAGVMVVDFGTSVLAEVAGATRTGELTGTPGWLAPEQALGHTLTPAADIFNFGMVLAYAATGQHPFGQGRPDAMLFRIVHQEPDLSAVPERLKLVVSRCLEKEPRDRPTLDEVRRILSLGGSGSGSSEGPSDPRTRLGSTTRIGAQAIQDAGSVSRPPPAIEKLTRRQRIVTGATAATIALLATAVLIVGRADASGPVEYTIVDNSTPANAIVSEPVVRLRSGSQDVTLSLKDKPSTRTRVDGIVWSTEDPLVVDYVPGFANDESTSLRVELSALGNNRMTRGWRTLLDVQIFDDHVQLTVRAPETRLVFLPRMGVAEVVRLERQNETEYLRMVAIQLREAQAAARSARSQCAQSLIRTTESRFRPLFDLYTKYQSSLTANRLNQGGTFNEAAFRSRITGLLSDMGVHQGLTRGVRLPDGFADPFPVADAFASALVAHSSLESAWSSYRIALLAERLRNTCTSSFCYYKDIYPGEVRAVENAEERLSIAVSQARGALGREANATCEALHPIPEG